MSWRSKYVVIDTGSFVLPIVFSDLACHADIAHPWRGEVLGAGFCYINEEGRYTCYGESTSLKVRSRGEEDDFILNRCLGVVHDCPCSGLPSTTTRRSSPALT